MAHRCADESKKSTIRQDLDEAKDVTATLLVTRNLRNYPITRPAVFGFGFVGESGVNDATASLAAPNFPSC
jgi:hypothetical protein